MRRLLLNLLPLLAVFAVLLVGVQPAPAQQDTAPITAQDALHLHWRAGLGEIQAVAPAPDDTLLVATAGATYQFQADDLASQSAPPIAHPGLRALDTLAIPTPTANTPATIALGLYTVAPSPAYYVGLADAETGQRRALFRLPAAPPNLPMNLHTDAAGNWLLVNRVGHDTTLIDLNAGRIVGSLEGGQARLLPDGRVLNPFNNDLTVLRLPTLAVLETLELGAGFDIERLFLSPDGAVVGVGTFNFLTIVLDATTLQPTRLLEVPTVGTAQTFSADGSRLVQATGDGLAVVRLDDGSVREFDIFTRTELNTIRSIAPLTGANGAQQVAVAVDDRLRLFDLASGELLAEHTAFARFGLPAFSADSSTVFSATSDGAILGFDLASGDEVLRIEQQNLPAAVAATHGTLAAADGQGVRFYDPASGATQGRVALPEFSDDAMLLYGLQSVAVAQLRFSPDGRWLAASTVDGRIWVVDVGAVLAGETAEPSIRLVYAHRPLLVVNLFWLNETDLVSVGTEGDFVRSVVGTTQIQTFDINERGEFELLAYNTADDYGLIHDAFSLDGAVYAFDFVQQRTQGQSVVGRGNPAQQAIRGVFSPSGAVLAVIHNWQLRLLDASSREAVLAALPRLQATTADVVQLGATGRPVFSPDGRYLVVSQSDGALLAFRAER